MTVWSVDIRFMWDLRICCLMNDPACCGKRPIVFWCWIWGCTWHMSCSANLVDVASAQVLAVSRLTWMAGPAWWRQGWCRWAWGTNSGRSLVCWWSLVIDFSIGVLLQFLFYFFSMSEILRSESEVWTERRPVHQCNQATSHPFCNGASFLASSLQPDSSFRHVQNPDHTTLLGFSVWWSGSSDQISGHGGSYPCLIIHIHPTKTASI